MKTNLPKSKNANAFTRWNQTPAPRAGRQTLYKFAYIWSPQWSDSQRDRRSGSVIHDRSDGSCQTSSLRLTERIEIAKKTCNQHVAYQRPDRKYWGKSDLRNVFRHKAISWGLALEPSSFQGKKAGVLFDCFVTPTQTPKKNLSAKKVWNADVCIVSFGGHVTPPNNFVFYKFNELIFWPRPPGKLFAAIAQKNWVPNTIFTDNCNIIQYLSDIEALGWFRWYSLRLPQKDASFSQHSVWRWGRNI